MALAALKKYMKYGWPCLYKPTVTVYQSVDDVYLLGFHFFRYWLEYGYLLAWFSLNVQFFNSHSAKQIVP
jgi:hypothetical protein